MYKFIDCQFVCMYFFHFFSCNNVVWSISIFFFYHFSFASLLCYQFIILKVWIMDLEFTMMEAVRLYEYVSVKTSCPESNGKRSLNCRTINNSDDESYTVYTFMVEVLPSYCIIQYFYIMKDICV